MPRLALALLVVCTVGCRVEPADDLFDCNNCPADKRCHEEIGACVDNSVPEIAPLPPVAAIAGTEIAITVTATDADGDELIIIWEQVADGSPLFPETREGATLTLTTEDLGTFIGSLAFTVSVDDGYGGTAEATISVTVRNEEPTLRAADTVYFLLGAGDGINFDPDPQDADGHTVTVEWIQVTGPAVVFDVDPSTYELSATPTEYGAYGFEAIPNDGFGDGDTVRYLAVVQPEQAVVYVNQLAPEPDGGGCGFAGLAVDCGCFLYPCRSVADGIAAVRRDDGAVPAPAPGEASTTIMVAANTGGAVYSDCLYLAGDEILLGGFDPEGWGWRAELRSRTRILCDSPDGHSMAERSVLRDLTLSSSVDAAAAVDGMAMTLAIANLTQPDGSLDLVEVRDVNVEAAACGPACASVGVAVLNSQALLTGVEISGVVSGFEVVQEFIGLTSYGGSVTFETSGTTPEDIRGSVLMNVPASEMSWGILMGRGELTVSAPDLAVNEDWDKLRILGGYSSYLVGIETWGGELTVDGALIDMAAFGSQVVMGIQSSPCDASYTAWPCACDLSGPCDAPVLAPAQPLVTVVNSSLTLHGSSSATAQVPCVGAGIGMASERTGALIATNDIRLEDSFNFGVGLYIYGFGPAADASSADHILDNAITVEGGNIDYLCQLLDVFGGGGQFTGAIGATITGDKTTVAGNVMSVGTHDVFAIGLESFENYEDHENTDQVLVGNVISVGDRLLGDDVPATPFAVGAALYGISSDTGFNLFAGNEVRVGSAVEYASAIDMSADASLTELRWVLANNFAYGGDGLYPTGLSIAGAMDGSPFPYIYANTILGGGHYEPSLITRGIALSVVDDASVPGGGTAGELRNNLIDAGGGVGRRFLVENAPGNFFFDDGGTSEVNVTQYLGTALGPQPSFIGVPPTWFFDPPTYFVLYAGTGQIATIVDPAAGLAEVATNETRGRVDDIWAGPVGYGASWVVTVMGDEIGQAMVGNADGGIIGSGNSGTSARLSPFLLAPLYTYEGGERVRRHPADLVAGEFDGEYPPDVMFIEGPSSGGTEGGIWLMRLSLTQGWLAPTSVPLFDSSGSSITLTDPYAITKTPDGGVLIADATPSGTTVYFGSAYLGVADAAVNLWELPDPYADTTQVLDSWIGELWEDGVAVEDLYPDVLILSEQQLVVFFDLNVLAPDPPTSWFDDTGTEYTPCSAGGAGVVPIAFAGGDLCTSRVLDLDDYEIVVACSDDRVEIFAYDDAGPGYALLVEHSIPENSSMVVNGSGVNARLVTTSQTANSIRTYDLQYEIVGGWSLVQVHELLLEKHIAMIADDGTHAVDFAGTFFADPLPDGATDPCPLLIREDVGPDFAYTYDLHLDPAAVGTLHGCEDSGEPLAALPPYGVTDDIDGEARHSTAPDVGADEVP